VAPNLRVVMAPIEQHLPFGVAVSGTILSLHAFGDGETFAPSEPVPATLEFSVAFVTAPRDKEQTAFRAVALLEGELGVNEAGAPLFTLSEGARLDHGEDPPPPVLGRTVDVKLAPESFRFAEDDPGLVLNLPPEPADCEFAEVAVSLLIEDEASASPKNSDHLDVPLLQVARVALRYEDESPMVEAKFHVVGGGHVVEGTTDEDGSALVFLPRFGRGTFRLFLDEFEERFVVSQEG